MPHTFMRSTFQLSMNEVTTANSSMNIPVSQEVIDVSKPVGPELFRARFEVTNEILRILKDRYSGGKVPDDMYNKMAKFATQLEQTLFKKAQSYAEYQDLTTLKARIKQIAAGINSTRPIPLDKKHYVPLPHRPSNISAESEKSIDYNSSAVRQQIQRILLLRHASRCSHQRGECPHMAHCGALKDLWDHISSCSDRSCKFRHCVSSRYILSHYSKCDSEKCPVCVPVRHVIRSSSERKRSMSAADLYERESKVPRTEDQDYATVAASPRPAQFLDRAIREKFISILEELCRRPYADIFATPVDEQGLDLMDYHDIISNPMDLGTILSRLHDARFYKGIAEVVSDVHLTFDNAMLYNPAGSDVYQLAKSYRDVFDSQCQQQVWSLMRTGDMENCDLSKALSKS